MLFLLDTNVVSELRNRKKCDPNLLNWARSTIGAKHYISVISMGEIRKGIEILRRKSPQQTPAFDQWFSTLQTNYDGQILAITEEVADRWGRIMADQTRPVADSLIAATALTHGLKIVTRNTGDFEGLGVDLVNPFEFEQ